MLLRPTWRSQMCSYKFSLAIDRTQSAVHTRIREYDKTSVYTYVERLRAGELLVAGAPAADQAVVAGRDSSRGSRSSAGRRRRRRLGVIARPRRRVNVWHRGRHGDCEAGGCDMAYQRRGSKAASETGGKAHSRRCVAWYEPISTYSSKR